MHAMYVFFREGGWSMYPILVIGLILLWSSCRFAIDREPSRRAFVNVLSLAYSLIVLHGVLTAVATVLWAVWDAKLFPEPERVPMMMLGFKESTRPAIMGVAFLSLTFLAIAIGVYRNGLRELRAAR